MNKRISQLLDSVRLHPEVIGLIEYGSSKNEVLTTDKDIDLLIVFKDEERVKSFLAARIEGVLFDVQLVSDAYLQRYEKKADFFTEANFVENGIMAYAFQYGRIVLDKNGILARLQRQMKGRKFEHYFWKDSFLENEYFWLNFKINHLIRKISRKSTLDTLERTYEMNAMIHRALQIYFAARKLDYSADRYGLKYLEQHEPEVFALLYKAERAWFTKTKLKYFLEFCELATEPLGGLWGSTFGILEESTLQVSHATKIKKIWSECVQRSH